MGYIQLYKLSPNIHRHYPRTAYKCDTFLHPPFRECRAYDLMRKLRNGDLKRRLAICNQPSAQQQHTTRQLRAMACKHNPTQARVYTLRPFQVHVAEAAKLTSAVTTSSKTAKPTNASIAKNVVTARPTESAVAKKTVTASRLSFTVAKNCMTARPAKVSVAIKCMTA